MTRQQLDLSSTGKPKFISSSNRHDRSLAKLSQLRDCAPKLYRLRSLDAILHRNHRQAHRLQ